MSTATKDTDRARLEERAYCTGEGLSLGAGPRVCLEHPKMGTGMEPAGGRAGRVGGGTGRCLLRLRRKVGLREAVSAPA